MITNNNKKKLTKNKYIKCRTGLFLICLMMLLVVTGCSKKKADNEVLQEQPTITEVPEVTEEEQEEVMVTPEPSNEADEVTPTVTPEPTITPETEEEAELTTEPEQEEDFTEEDKVETVVPEGEVLTKEQAVAVVAALSPETLKLAKELGQYSIIVDDWTTMVNGNECYCLNVYDYVNDRQQLVAMFYVTVDGKEVFVHDDELGEFVKIAE